MKTLYLRVHSLVRHPFAMTFLFFLLALYAVQYTGIKNSLHQDSHDKAILSYSIQKQKFMETALLYPGHSLDPEFSFFHLPTNLYLIHNGKLLSAFPIQFAWVGGLFLEFFPLDYLPYLSLLFAFGFLLLLNKLFRIPLGFLFLGFFSTFLWPMVWEFSEMSFLLCLIAIGFFPLTQNKPNLGKQILSGFCFALAWSIRMESLFFPISYVLYSLFQSRFSLSSLFQFFADKKFFILIFISFSILLGFINFLQSGHFLGTRYLANLKGFTTTDFATRLLWAKKLWFGGDLSIGFFGYLPLAFFLFLYCLFQTRVAKKKKALAFASLFTIFVIPWIAPNDGFNNWGPRFYASLLLPYILLAKSFWFTLYRKKKKSLLFLFVISFLFSFSLGILGAKMQKSKTSLVNSFVSKIKDLDPDMIVFPDYLNFYMVGSEYVNRWVYVAYTSEDVTTLVDRALKTYPAKSILLVSWNRLLFSEDMIQKVLAHQKASGYPTGNWDLKDKQKEWIQSGKTIRTENFGFYELVFLESKKD